MVLPTMSIPRELLQRGPLALAPLNWEPRVDFSPPYLCLMSTSSEFVALWVALLARTGSGFERVYSNRRTSRESTKPS